MNVLTQERLDALRQSPRSADVTDVEDLCEHIAQLEQQVKDQDRTRLMFDAELAKVRRESAEQLRSLASTCLAHMRV